MNNTINIGDIIPLEFVRSNTIIGYDCDNTPMFNGSRDGVRVQPQPNALALDEPVAADNIDEDNVLNESGIIIGEVTNEPMDEPITIDEKKG